MTKTIKSTTFVFVVVVVVLQNYDQQTPVMRMIASNSTELIKQRAYMTNFERFVLFGRFYLIVNAKFKSTRTASIRGNMVEKSVTSNAW